VIETGIMLRTPGGTRFWHRAASAEAGVRDMDAMHAETGVYGPNYAHPETVVEFGTSDGRTFTASQRLRPAAATPSPGN
jgi:hypothetical protein